MEENGMIHQCLIHSSFRGLLLQNDEWCSEKSLLLQRSISFRLEESSVLSFFYWIILLIFQIFGTVFTVSSSPRTMKKRRSFSWCYQLELKNSKIEYIGSHKNFQYSSNSQNLLGKPGCLYVKIPDSLEEKHLNYKSKLIVREHFPNAIKIKMF